MRALSHLVTLCLAFFGTTFAGGVLPQAYTADSHGSVSTSLPFAASDSASSAAFRKDVVAEIPGSISANSYWENAPLAFFSLGSLAVGGVFYGIQSSMSGPRVGYVAGDRTSLITAIGAAGLTSLISGGAYFYFCHKDLERNRNQNWDAQVSGSPTSDGHAQVTAVVTIRFPGWYF